MDRPRVLTVSNGAGEDSIANLILKNLPPQELQIEALPLVGEGASYQGTAPLVGPRQVMPSGGLIPEGLGNLVKDARGGLLKLICRQIRWLWQQRHNYDLTVAVGDLWPVALTCLAGHRPVLFIGTAKSDYHHAYSWPEALLLRLFKVKALVRDEPTARHLRRQGVQAAWVGNAMMDELRLDKTPQELGIEMAPDESGLCLFPGSRQATYRALPPMLEHFAAFASIVKQKGNHLPRPVALVALAPSIDPARLASACSNWQAEFTSRPKPGVSALLKRGDLRVLFVQGALAQAISSSLVGLGVAGTAHEQCVGLGVPVVAYEKDTQHLGWYRGRQKGLLGEALCVVHDDTSSVSQALYDLWSDPAKRARLGQEGQRRMGPMGGSLKMAGIIQALANGTQLPPLFGS